MAARGSGGLDTATTRFWAKVDVRDAASCWLWRGAMSNSGYGHFALMKRRHCTAHRAALMLTGHEIPDGMVVDHLCRNRQCVNPAHLEPVPQSVNVRRGKRWAEPVTHCKRGHEFTDSNTYVNPRGVRRCRACHHPPVGAKAPPSACPQGHLYDEENTYVRPKDGARMCRQCGRDRRARATPVVCPCAYGGEHIEQCSKKEVN